MRRLLVALVVVLAMPAAAQAKKTADFEFHSTGAAAAPGAVAGGGESGTYEDFPFTIAPDETDGSATIQITFANPADDWDLYIYRKNSTGGLETVGSATSPAGQTDETANVAAQSQPIPPGEYVIRVQNYAASTPNFDGTAKFTDYVVPNKRPVVVFKAPRRATTKQTVKLDATGSADPDGQIVNYAFDLDNDGSIETDNGTNPVLEHKFSAGIHYVAVRVTDDKGVRAYKTRTIRVREPRKKTRRGNR